MARGEPLFRQWRLLKTLQSHRFGISSSELAERLECTKRTILRDLDLLQQAGFPISFEQRNFGKKFWKLTHGFVESEKLALSVTEMLSLFLSQQLLAPLSCPHARGGEPNTCYVRPPSPNGYALPS